MTNKTIIVRRDDEDEEDQSDRMNFLWPYEDDSVEEAGHEFLNAKTEEYRTIWWNLLLERVRETK